MFVIREILGYCIISAVCLLGMAVLYVLRNRVLPAKQIAHFMFGACVIEIPLFAFLAVHSYCKYTVR